MFPDALRGGTADRPSTSGGGDFEAHVVPNIQV